MNNGLWDSYIKYKEDGPFTAVDEYDAAIVYVLEKEDVLIHDFNTMIDADDELICEDNIQLSQK